VDVLGGGIEIVGENGESLAFRKYPSDHKSIAKRLQMTTAIAHPTAMIRKRAIDEYGGYDLSFRFSEDLDLWLRFLAHGIRFANLQQVLVKYRQVNTYRSPTHWRFNLRARLRNFRLQFLPQRIFGICMISIWACLPAGLQSRIFHGLVLRRNLP
jgi:hypothetical protein